MSTLRERLALDYKPTKFDLNRLDRAEEKREKRRRNKLARASDVQVTAQEV